MPLTLQHFNIKIFVEGDLALDSNRLIDVFHQWIQERALDEMLIDVADYGHVPGGPGVLLIALEADYCMDHTDDRWGLRYNRKAPLEGSNEDRFRQAFQSTARACRMLEDHFASGPALRFSRNEFEMFINDRALAPNTPETHAAFQPELNAILKSVFGHQDFRMDRPTDPRRRFGFTITAGRPFALS